MVTSFCVESIHEHPDIKINYYAFKSLVKFTESFVIQALKINYCLSNLIILCGWFYSRVQILSEIKELAQTNIDQVYKSAIREHYQAVKSSHIEFSPLITMYKSNLAEITAQYGHYLYKNQRYQLANKYYSQSIANNPNHLTAYNQQGMCFAHMGYYERARDAFREILNKTTHAQTQADAHLNIAWSFRLEVESQPELEKKTEQALEHMAKAKHLSPNDLDIIAEERNIMELRLSKVRSSANKGFFFQPSLNAITPDQLASEIQEKITHSPFS